MSAPVPLGRALAPSTSAALGYLLVRSYAGRARRALRLLRQPRYAVGLVLGLGYVGLFMIGPTVVALRAPAESVRDPEVVRTARLAAGALFGLLLLLQCSTLEEGLAFRDGELAFLAAAPLSRSWLVAYRLLDGQVAIIAMGAVFGLVAALSPGGSVGSFVGTILVFELIAMVRVYWALAAGSLRARGIAPAWLHVVPVGLVLALALAAFASHRELEREGRSPFGPGAWARVGRSPMAAVGRLAAVDPFRTALRPFDALGAAVLPVGGSEHAVACGFVAALMAAVIAGIFASRAEFVPASLTLSRRLADLRRTGANRSEPADGPDAPRPAVRSPAAADRARSYAPFTLAPRGRPSVAILWLVLSSGGPRTAPRRLATYVVAAGAAGLAVAASGIVPEDAQVVVAGLTLQVAFTIAAVGGQRMTGDLIAHPARLALMKSLPLTGTSIVAGEVMALAIVQSTVTLAGWAFAVGLMSTIDGHPIAPEVRLAAGASGTALIVSIALLVHASTRALALFLPGWFRSAGLPAQGMAAFGQNLLVLFARLVLLVAATIPAGLVAAILAAASVAALGTGDTGTAVAILAGGLGATAAYVGGAVLAARMAGEIAYPRCEPSELA